MRRGGWRKRAAEGDGWGIWGGYMSAKVKKLGDQFRSESAVQRQRDGNSSSIFSGVAIYVNGLTDPSADELRRLMMLHGGQYHVYYSRSKTTHIIATNLPNAKIKELKGEKVVRPEWIVESIKAGRLLSYIPYQLYTKQSSVQKGLNFNSICKPEDAMPGPSNIANDLNRVNHIKKHEMENEITPNGINSWNEEEEEESDDLGFTDLEQILPGRKQNGIQSHKDSAAIFNGHTHTSTSALKKQDCLVPCGSSVASRFCPGPEQDEGKTEKGVVDFRDCTMQQLQQSNKNTGFSWNPHRTMSNSSSSSSLHSNAKINGAHHSTVQGPSSTKSTSVPASSKAASLPVSKPDCSFISDFYSRSRLHHISTWKCELTEFVNSLQRKNSGVFPGREKLKKWKAGRSALKTDTGNVSVASSAKPQSCIMHVDMDCFFVSVAIRNRPDLKGKPVAVTSNKGAGKAALRPGANPQLEQQYYQNKLMNGKAEIRVPDKLDSPVWEHPDSTHVNGADFNLTVLSMAEIASCSYEARQVGIKNGMFFGQAKKLCPNLQAVSYDFDAYKEVAQTVYEILARLRALLFSDDPVVATVEIWFDDLHACADPGAPEHGYKTPSAGVFFESVVVRFHCQEGYRLNGTSKKLCVRHFNGSLSWKPSDKPVCLQEVTDCLVPHVEDAEVHNKTYRTGDKLIISCHEGFQIRYPDLDNMVSICQDDGTWDNLPICQGCLRPLVLPHSYINISEFESSFPIGTVVYYQCFSGYKLEGAEFLECMYNLIWSDSPPRCLDVEVCPLPPMVSHGDYICHPRPCERYNHGTVVEFYCDPGYTLTNDYKYITCQYGEWFPSYQVYCVKTEQTWPNTQETLLTTWKIVAFTATSVLLVLLLVILARMFQTKFKTHFLPRGNQEGSMGDPDFVVVDGVPVMLPSYDEAVSSGSNALAPGYSATADQGHILQTEDQNPPAYPGPRITDTLPSESETCDNRSDSSELLQSLYPSPACQAAALPGSDRTDASHGTAGEAASTSPRIDIADEIPLMEEDP